ncbi:MAG: hypothetical protein WCJ42_05040 [Actinomycetes bacterium]
MTLMTGFGVGFVLFFVFCGLLILGVMGFMVFVAVRRWKVAKAQGFDPLAGDIQLMGTVNRSAMLAPASPDVAASSAQAGAAVASRLAELDALLAAGTLSEAEHAEARARIIAGL